MTTERVLVWGVVAVVVATTLASGPLVAAVDLTTEPDRPAFGEGNVSVADVSLPGRATITAGRFGAGTYYLRVPDATVELESVSGNPLLAYRLDVADMGYARSTTHFVSSSNVGTYRVTFTQVGLDPSDVMAQRHDARLELLLRSNGSQRVLAARDVVVEVVE